MKKPMLRAVLLLQMVADTIVALVLFMWPWTAAKLGTAWVDPRSAPLAQFAGVLVGLAAATCWGGFRDPLQTVSVARVRGHANWIAAVLLLTHVFILKIDAGVDSRLLMAGLGALALMFAGVELVLAGHLTVRDALERHRFTQWLHDHPDLEEAAAPSWERREPVVDEHAVTDAAGLTAAAADWRREPVIGGIAPAAAPARVEPVIPSYTPPSQPAYAQPAAAPQPTFAAPPASPVPQPAATQPAQPAQPAPQPAAEPYYPSYVRAVPQPKPAAPVEPVKPPVSAAVPQWDFAPDPEPQPSPAVAEVAATPRSFEAHRPELDEPGSPPERQGWLQRFLSYF